MRAVLTLGVFVAAVSAASFVGAQFLPGEWYQALRRPPLTPPNWIFGPVWSFLYLCIATAAFLVWRVPDSSGRALALTLWGIQLGLNALWSYLFFGLEHPGLALAEIIVLLGLVAATTAVFFSIRKPAGALFLPYVLWVAFATYLNAGFWYLNRDAALLP